MIKKKNSHLTWDCRTSLWRPLWALLWRWLDAVRPSYIARTSTHQLRRRRSMSFGIDCLRNEHLAGSRPTLSSLWWRRSADQRNCALNVLWILSKLILLPTTSKYQHRLYEHFLSIVAYLFSCSMWYHRVLIIIRQ